MYTLYYYIFMTVIVSISLFRQNIANYLEQVSKGITIILQDEKKDKKVAQLIKIRNFNPESFEKALEGASGVFTDKNHPEWKTKEKVINWLEKERESSDRKF